MPTRTLQTQALTESDYDMYLGMIRRLRNFEEVVRHHFLEGDTTRRQYLEEAIRVHLMAFYRAEFAQDRSTAAPIRARLKSFHQTELASYSRSGFEPIDCGGLCYNEKEGCVECQ